MTRPRYLAVLPYLGAVTIVLIATLTRAAADAILQDRQPFAVFFVAVIVTARFCRVAPSILALLLSAVSARFFFMPPRGSLAVYGLDQEASFWIFLLVGLFIVFVMRSERRAREEVRRQSLAAAHKQQELEREIAGRELAERHFQAIYERAPLGIALVDSEGRFLQVNPKYEAITGRTEKELVQLAFQSITHPDDLELNLSNTASLNQGKTSQFDMQKRYLRPDGSVVWVNITVVTMRETDLAPLRQLAIVDDITEHKAVENALRESEDRFRAFMNHIPAIAWAKDEQGRYVYLNKAYEERFHVRMYDRFGKTDFDVWPEEIARGYWETDQKALTYAEPIQVTEESVSDGNERHHWLNTKFYFQDSRYRRFVGGVGIDVTQLKRTEQALRHEQDLLRRLIEVQENKKLFLCHEIHDGLMQYAIGSQMLLESYRSNRPSADDLSQIDTAIDSLRKGIEDGRRVIRGVRPAVLDNSGIEGVLEDLVGQFATSGMMVTSKCDPGIGRLPEMIQTTIYRIVQEALNNAKKHSGTDVVRIELKQSGGNLHLVVCDFGCGFDVESARERGFGLVGMAERVRLHGGECHIQSELDAGTHISVRLPMSSADHLT